MLNVAIDEFREGTYCGLITTEHANTARTMRAVSPRSSVVPADITPESYITLQILSYKLLKHALKRVRACTNDSVGGSIG